MKFKELSLWRHLITVTAAIVATGLFNVTSADNKNSCKYEYEKYMMLLEAYQDCGGAYCKNHELRREYNNAALAHGNCCNNANTNYNGCTSSSESSKGAK